jgi:hypothetical protein
VGGWVWGWVGGWVGGEKLTIKLNSAQLELDLGLSLAIFFKEVGCCVGDIFEPRLMF